MENKKLLVVGLSTIILFLLWVVSHFDITPLMAAHLRMFWLSLSIGLLILCSWVLIKFEEKN